MGLDMYLMGRKDCKTFEYEGSKPIYEDGHIVDHVYLQIGYWRKHPNLHGYIVQAFADGEDDCRPIHLDEDKIDQIIAAIKDRSLPDTTGFFFGRSDGSDEEVAEDIEILTKAKDWLKAELGPHEWARSIYYQASW
jgi:hypothetical protein